MDPTLIIAAAMTILKPLLEKTGEKVGETIGQRLSEKSSWQKITEIFVVDDDKEIIQAIEKKPIATQEEIDIIEDKLTKVISSNPEFAMELQATFNISPTNIFIAEQLLKSIQRDRKDLKHYYEQRRNASPDAVGGYKVMIARTVRRLKEDEEELIALITI